MGKKCPHNSFQRNGKFWKCQFCEVDFSAEEVEKIMIRRRQGFVEDPKSGDFDSQNATRNDLKQ